MGQIRQFCSLGVTFVGWAAAWRRGNEARTQTQTYSRAIPQSKVTWPDEEQGTGMAWMQAAAGWPGAVPVGTAGSH